MPAGPPWLGDCPLASRRSAVAIWWKAGCEWASFIHCRCLVPVLPAPTPLWVEGPPLSGDHTPDSALPYPDRDRHRAGSGWEGGQAGVRSLNNRSHLPFPTPASVYSFGTKGRGWNLLI